MKHVNIVFLILFVFIFSFAYPLIAAELTYDMATGKISGFDLTDPDDPSTPIASAYTGSTEVWNSPGFVGRLNYRGEPTTLKFTNTGPVARNTSGTKGFYFTRYPNTNSNRDRWRQFFLVTRMKGLLHNGTQDDFSGINKVVSNNEGTIVIPPGAGAGPEQVTSGPAYSITGAGPLAADSTYKYKYKYQYIWVDITIKKSATKRNLNKGYYETQFTITGDTGVSYTMNLIGEIDPSGTEPSAFYFGIENVVAKPFPYSDLINKNAVENSLLVGKLRYFSVVDSAEVKFSSNSAGTAATFDLKLDGGTTLVRYYLVFDPTAPNEDATKILLSTPAFESNYQPTISPIDGSSTPGNVLEGEIRIFVDENTLPMSGKYTSTIYCILTQT